MKDLDPALLRTLVTFADTGTLDRTARIVGRTPSAVTAQVQRLEATVGAPLLRALGRRRVLTPAGEHLVAHARRILAAHEDAWLCVRGITVEGHVGLGVTQDMADQVLPSVLNRFARSHPRVRLDVRVAMTADLMDAFQARRIDVLAGLLRDMDAGDVVVHRDPMRWLCADGGLVTASHQDVPVALLDPPCGFRDVALTALEAAGRPYRIAAVSQSLSGLWAVVRAGVAVTVRTIRWAGPGINVTQPGLGLPDLPSAAFSVRVRDDASAAARHLADLLARTTDGTSG